MLSALSPRQLFRAALDLELTSASALEASASTPSARLHWTEHRNRLHAFGLFQFADITLGADERADLADLVAAAFDFAPFDRIWIIEGSGYWWANRALALTLPPRVTTARFAEASLIPLHAGVGLAIATHMLRDIDHAGVCRLFGRLVDRCRAFAAPGFECVALEASGLAVRTLHPRLGRWFDDCLRDDPVLRRCFWHGIGRGTYFAPSNWMSTPAVTWRSVAALPGTGDDAAAKNGAVRGFAWAVTLVNMRAPGVLERYARVMIDACDVEPLARGVQSALVAWQHAAPDDGSLDLLLTYEPVGAAASRAWNVLVREPALRALAIATSVTRDHLADSLFGEIP
jgi:hypothetical protein